MAFNKIFWGLLFMFDFRLQGVDILPDIIGYILILSALNELLSKNEHFTNAKNLCFPLLILSIFDIYQRPQQPNGFAVTSGNPILILLGIVLMIVHLLMIYHICMGIVELAREANNSYLENLSYSRWKFYLVMQIIFIFVVPLGFLIPALIVVLFLPLLILSLAAMIMMMSLMKSAERELQG